MMTPTLPILMSATMKFVTAVIKTAIIIMVIKMQQLNVQMVSISLDTSHYTGYNRYGSHTQLIVLKVEFDWWVELLTMREELKCVKIAVGCQFAATDGLIVLLDRCAKWLDLLALVGS